MSKFQTKIEVVVSTNFDISRKTIIEEILLAETRMNTNSKLRFHINTNMQTIKTDKNG